VPPGGTHNGLMRAGSGIERILTKVHCKRVPVPTFAPSHPHPDMLVGMIR